jgi:hypothetical protein
VLLQESYAKEQQRHNLLYCINLITVQMYFAKIILNNLQTKVDNSLSQLNQAKPMWVETK